ncbi:hypothetical protein C9374_009397 [Naegleria lovaniensis]|uniref:Uncharacterized protein n=1 Tax=Naegleria lovaniensis TaxID=51637 RepID=A0AA88KGT8_NAELO|nr:uncharacterized protein C9374_009397 [Naegleria lovaniensis]KAG2377486.1 hypothetical protein C9374_009397 [Naegleria lovaniensis]
MIKTSSLIVTLLLGCLVLATTLVLAGSPPAPDAYVPQYFPQNFPPYHSVGTQWKVTPPPPVPHYTFPKIEAPQAPTIPTFTAPNIAYSVPEVPKFNYVPPQFPDTYVPPPPKFNYVPPQFPDTYVPPPPKFNYVPPQFPDTYVPPPPKFNYVPQVPPVPPQPNWNDYLKQFPQFPSWGDYKPSYSHPTFYSEKDQEY